VALSPRPGSSGNLLTGEALAALLKVLGPDRETAAERYETIRRKLIRLFEWRGCAFPEDLADETINRAARRFAEGVEVRSADPYGYFCGIAHLLYKESMRRHSREHLALESGDWLAVPAAEEAEPDQRLEVLRDCLQALPDDQRRLVLQYHQDEDHIHSRKEMAENLGLPMNALRIRVHRIRRRLEDCVTEKLRN
jgi:DNA-directed RNA polymerase specialized sigma24 family protein